MKFRTVTTEKRALNLNTDAINAYCSRWKPGTPLDVEITRKMPGDPIRKKYWKYVFEPFALEIGYGREDWRDFHKQLRAKYWQIDHDRFGVLKNVPGVFRRGATRPDGKPVTHADRIDFISFVGRVAAKQGVYIDMGDR